MQTTFRATRSIKFKHPEGPSDDFVPASSTAEVCSNSRKKHKIRFEHDRQAQKRCRLLQESRSTRLSCRRPVLHVLAYETWQLILERCELRFLFNKARFVCRTFNDILKLDDVWRRARENEFGDMFPDCPRDISERQYADLLTGAGCHGCGLATRTVYWSFLKRFCVKCLDVAVDRVPQHGGIDFKSLSSDDNSDWPEQRVLDAISHAGLVPAAPLEDSQRTQSIRRNINFAFWPKLYSADEQNWKFRYHLKEDRTDLKRKYLAAAQNPDFDVIVWLQECHRAVRDRMLFAGEMELICWRPAKKALESNKRGAKELYFKRQAEKLQLPICIDILKESKVFQDALETPIWPLGRAWQVLRSQLNEPGVLEEIAK